MRKKSINQDALRKSAEEQLTLATKPKPLPPEELLHELQVHQIELEMQNDELRCAQTVMENMRDRYFDLYEFASVGYLTLNRAGMITEANLSGAALLGVERKKLLNRRFSHFVISENHDQWDRHFQNGLQSDGRQNCELALQRLDGSRLHVLITSLKTDNFLNSHKLDDPLSHNQSLSTTSLLRLAITDITAHKQLERQLRDLTAYVQSVREEEKASIAREIHDDLGGTLLTLKMETHWLKDELSTRKEATSLLDHVQYMSQAIDHAAGIMRNIITGLRPPILDEIGLLAALEWQAVHFQNRTGIKCRVNCIGDKGLLDISRSIELFRISQEALSNVARHSGASSIEFEYLHNDTEVVMSIIDNGRGITKTHTDTSKHFGILGMRERVDQLSGRISFDTPPGGGFSVTVILPLTTNKKKKR